MKRVALIVALLAVVASSASAQTAPSRGWVEVNFITQQSAQDEQDYTLRAPLFRETATATTVYPALPNAQAVEVGAGFGFARHFGVGVGFNAANYESIVALGVTIPHPTVFNRLASDTDVTESSLERKDRSVDIRFVYSPTTPDAWQVRLFGGPTYFSVSQEMVEIVRYNQLFNVLTGANVVDITTFTQNEVSGSGWGFNVGGDVAYFFARHVGVGGVIRVNRGTVSIDSEPLTHEAVDLDAGHVTLGGGLRLRF